MNLDAGIIEVNTTEIIPNRFQPRLNFDEKALKELAESIKQHGIIQPLVLRKIGDKYEIIAGERRYRASQMAGLTKVPAVIANIDDNTSAEVALVENIQRKNLTAIEEAKSYKNLLDKGYLTQDQLAKRLGLSQSAISNKLRLLNLADEVQEALLSEKISERHARSLLKLENKEEQIQWLNKIIRDRMTVRQLDIELKKLTQEQDDSSDIPLVNLTPNIEEIKETAMDINPEPAPKIIEDFFPEQTEPEEIKEQTIVADINQQVPRKFFNFLEDEEANLDTGDLANNTFNNQPIIEPQIENSITNPNLEIVDMPIPNMPVENNNENVNELNINSNVEPIEYQSIQSNIQYNEAKQNNDFNQFNNQYSQDLNLENNINQNITSDPIIELNPFNNNSASESIEQNNNFNQFNNQYSQDLNLENNINQNIVSEPIVELNSSLSEPTYDYLNSNNNQEIPTSNTILYESQKAEEVITDPVSMIDRLDPEYENKQDALAGLDLRSAIFQIREMVKDIENKGFLIDIDEIDFDTSYQITIKIEKNNE